MASIFETMKKIQEVCPPGSAAEEALCDALTRYYCERTLRIARTKARMSPGDAQSLNEYTQAMQEVQHFEEAVARKRTVVAGYGDAEAVVTNLLLELGYSTVVTNKMSSLITHYFRTHGGCRHVRPSR